MSIQAIDADCKVLSTGYSFHTKPFRMTARGGFKTYLLRIQTEGKARCLIGNQYLLVETGDMMFFPPNKPYDLVIDAEVQAAGEKSVYSGDYYIFFSGPWVDRWLGKTERPRIIKSPGKEQFITLFRQIALEQRRYSTRDDEIMGYFLKILCRSIDRALSEQPSMNGSASIANRMKSYIEEHAVSRFQLADVAAHVNMSVSRSVHLFKTMFDCSIMQYALDVRLRIACERILHSPLTLEQAAESSGFASYTYFHRCFRAKFGISPKQYRLTNGAEG